MTVRYLLPVCGNDKELGMTEMFNRVRSYMELYHMVESGDKIVVGVSGGADSVMLLHVLWRLQKEWGLQLWVVHVHHGIRQEADEDVSYVQELCNCMEIPCYTFYEDVPALAAQNKLSEEEMGRRCRYKHFAETLNKTGADKIAVAHHMDDQAETVLFHLSRGTGLAGMRGMLPVSTWKEEGEEREYRLIRPLLDCRKQEIIAYLKMESVAWREDVTNQDCRYARNRIRNEILPAMEHVNEQAVAHITGFAKQAAEYEQFFHNRVMEYMDEHIVKGNGDIWMTDRGALLQKEPVFAKAVLYEMLCKSCGRKKDISRIHVDSLYALLGNQSGKELMLPYEMRGRISYEKLIIGKSSQEKEPAEESVWGSVALWELQPGETKEIVLGKFGRLKINRIVFENMDMEKRKELLEYIRNSKNNYTKYFGCDTIENTLYIRKPQQKDDLVMDVRGRRKRLSRYFIDAKIPGELRKGWPLVVCDDEILWVTGLRRAEVFPVCMDTKYIIELRYEGDSHELSY